LSFVVVLQLRMVVSWYSGSTTNFGSLLLEAFDASREK
jgi:hypothetical protein